jgi:Fibronectin type III-like domain
LPILISLPRARGRAITTFTKADRSRLRRRARAELRARGRAAEGVTPQFPFGYGLSYTTFAFSHLNAKPASDAGADVSFRITNTGSVDGADVAQVYVGPPADQPAGIQFAVRSLAQFQRVELAPGQSRKLVLHIAARNLSYWSSSAQRWILDSAGRSVYVGDADAPSSLPLQGTLGRGAHDQTCSNQAINSTTVNGDLIVPPGSWCDLVSDTIHGDVILKKATGVRVQSATIDGNLVAKHTRSAADPLSSGTNVVCNSTINGDVRIVQNGRGANWDVGGCGPNTIGGRIIVQSPGHDHGYVRVRANHLRRR